MNNPMGVAAAAAAVLLAGILGLAIIIGGVDGAGCQNGATPTPVAVSNDGSPTILGATTLTVAQLVAGYTRGGWADPTPVVGVPITVLAGWYIAHGQTEGVRGDIAFAQAIEETGGFANQDSHSYNFAGIAHCDSCGSGSGFPGPEAGVVAQLQDLKFYAAGNQAQLTEPRVAPFISDQYAGKRPTWGSLTGAWATDPGYWQAISHIYGQLGGPANPAPGPATVAAGGCDAAPAVSGDPTGCGPALPATLALAPDDRVRAVITAACTQIGKPYQLGAGHGAPGFDLDLSPPAFDCSSFVAWAWARGGVNIDGDTYTQVNTGTPVPDLAHAQPGDLIFTENIGHVMLYMGNETVIEAPHTGDTVKVIHFTGPVDAIRRL